MRSTPYPTCLSSRQGASKSVIVLGRSGVSSAGGRGRERHYLTGRAADGAGSTPVLADHEELGLGFSAERAGEGTPVQVDRRQDVPTATNPHAALVPNIRVPKGAARIEADPIGMVSRRCGPDPTVAEGSITSDRVLRQ